MTTFRLTLEYDGTDFRGWQRQGAGERTVQGVLEEAVARVTGRASPVAGSGRTDAGVHACGQVASLSSDTALDAATLQRALNAELPPDVVVLAAESVPDGFHARYDARWKRYRYRIWNGAVPSPLRARVSHWVAPALRVDAMAGAAEAFRGEHDFASLQAAGSGVEDSVRTLHALRVEGATRGEIALDVTGSGFLRHMVRTLAGTLIEVGLGRRDAASMPSLLAARDRRAAGATAPAAGLTLMEVGY